MLALRISRPSRERRLIRIPPILTRNATARPSVQLNGIPAIYSTSALLLISRYSCLAALPFLHDPFTVAPL